MTEPRTSTPEHGYVSHADLATGFDAFYKDARDRLLLQTFALTGDLAVARSAVREAFVVAWHHWRKTSRLDDPEMSVRPNAWRKAVRRSSHRPWHRRKDLEPDVRAVLDGLKTQATRRRPDPQIQPGSLVRGAVNHFADLEVTDIERKRLGEFTEDVAQQEGGYTLAEFREYWRRVNGEWNPDEVVYLIRFRVARVR